MTTKQHVKWEIAGNEGKYADCMSVWAYLRDVQRTDSQFHSFTLV